MTFAGTSCTSNPLGVKGCAEADAIALLPAFANAIADVVTNLDDPATPFRAWQAMRSDHS